jgi:hypothetical protein
MRSIVRVGVNRRGPPTCDAETWHLIDCHLTFAFAELTRFLAASLSVISTACRGHEWRELADTCVGVDACGCVWCVRCCRSS